MQVRSGCRLRAALAAETERAGGWAFRVPGSRAGLGGREAAVSNRVGVLMHCAGAEFGLPGVWGLPCRLQARARPVWLVSLPCSVAALLPDQSPCRCLLCCPQGGHDLPAGRAVHALPHLARPLPGPHHARHLLALVPNVLYPGSGQRHAQGACIMGWGQGYLT